MTVPSHNTTTNTGTTTPARTSINVPTLSRRSLCGQSEPLPQIIGKGCVDQREDLVDEIHAFLHRIDMMPALHVKDDRHCLTPVYALEPHSPRFHTAMCRQRSR